MIKNNMAKKIKVNLSEEDLQDLLNGEVFEWNMGGRQLYIYNEDRHDLLCTEEGCMELQGEDGEVCDKCKR